MAATIAKATGYDHSRAKETSRLGSDAAQAEANTWQTFTTCTVRKDGSGSIVVKRGRESVRVDFKGEIGALEPTILVDGLEVTPVRTHWGEDYGKK